MKRATWITLFVFALLLAVWFVRSRPQKTQTLPPLSVDGYIGNVGIEEARTLGQKQSAPYTRIVLTRSDGKDGKEVIELTKQDADKPAVEPKPEDKTPPPEAKWQASRTLGGKTTTWKAQGFRATTMTEQLQRSIRSTFAVRIDAKGAAEYGLDPQHAVDIELSGGKAPVKLRVGLLQKAEKDGEATTWVADPAHPDVAYQLAGRDLRTAFDVSWNELRDRQLLPMNVDDVTELELVWPGAKQERIVVSRPAVGTDKDAQRPWTFTEPAGVRTGDIDDWLKAAEHLSAAEFLPSGDPAAKDTGLDDPRAPRLTISNKSEKTILTFGKQDETRPNKEAWLRVSGREEVYRISSYQHDQLVQSLNQLRDRHVLAGHTVEELQGFTLTGPKSRFAATKDADGWRGASSKDAAEINKIKDFVQSLAALKVDYLTEAPASATLDSPEWTNQWTFADGVVTVTLSKEESGNVYGRILPAHGDPQTFKLTTGNAKQIQKQAADFAASSPPDAAAQPTFPLGAPGAP